MSDPSELVRSGEGPLAELMLHVRADEDFADVWRSVALLGAAPSVEGVVYREDMTVDLGEPLVAGVDPVPDGVADQRQQDRQQGREEQEAEVVLPQAGVDRLPY